MNASSEPSCSSEQIKQYFDRIGLDDMDVAVASTHATSSNTSTQLRLLTKLLHHTLANVPFENLDLHYSQVRGVSINTTHLFDKVVTRNAGRGGYCMQNNALFTSVLRSLGYNVYSAGAKVANSFDEPQPHDNAKVTDGVQEIEFGGYGHQVNIVTLTDGSRYMLDVSFGARGPAWPIPLKHGFTRINTGIADNVATSLKLIRGFPSDTSPGARRPETAFWVFAIKYAAVDDTSKQWIPCYCFSELEFFVSDFQVMNAYVSTNHTSLFLNNVICQKFIIEDPGTEKAIVVGDITLNNESIKVRRYGKSESLSEIKTESDRVEALEKYLKVYLTQAEREGIKASIRAIR